MGELKPWWRRVKFGEVVRLGKERCTDPIADGVERYVGLEHIEPGDLRVRSWGDVADGTTFTTRVRPGQVLFGKRRAYQRKVAVADFDSVCSGDIYVFESADPKRLLPELLPFICQTDAFFDHAVGTSAGSLSPRTNWASLAEYEFALPPLEEQRRIALAMGATRRARESWADAEGAATRLEEAFCDHVAQMRLALEQVDVGEVAKFTSGKSIHVTELPQTPSPEAPIPVFGGNGLSGYTRTPLAGVASPTVVIGRVGQFCGCTLLTSGPSWVTDNALYPTWIDPRMDTAFLAIALRGKRLNRGKLGEYLPLINQKVVHATKVPLLSIDDQLLMVKSFGDLEAAHRATRSRSADAGRLHQDFINHVLAPGAP